MDNNHDSRQTSPQASRGGDTPPNAANGSVDITKPPFNAAGDGVTDDAPALQAAVDWMAKQMAVPNDANRESAGVSFPKTKFALGGTIDVPTEHVTLRSRHGGQA